MLCLILPCTYFYQCLGSGAAWIRNKFALCILIRFKKLMPETEIYFDLEVFSEKLKFPLCDYVIKKLTTESL
jgi:hypothetical protein